MFLQLLRRVTMSLLPLHYEVTIMMRIMMMMMMKMLMMMVMMMKMKMTMTMMMMMTTFSQGSIPSMIVIKASFVFQATRRSCTTSTFI